MQKNAKMQKNMQTMQKNAKMQKKMQVAYDFPYKTLCRPKKTPYNK